MIKIEKYADVEPDFFKARAFGDSNEVVTSVLGTFEQSRSTSIRAFKVNGTTVRHQLYPSDEKERCFHIFYNEKKHMAERSKLEQDIDLMAKQLKSWEGMQVRPNGKYAKYFDLVYYHEGKEDETFTAAREQTDVTDQEIRLCGYFVIITSEDMTAEELMQSEINAYNTKQAEKEAKAKAKAEKAQKDKERREKEKEKVSAS